MFIGSLGVAEGCRTDIVSIIFSRVCSLVFLFICCTLSGFWQVFSSCQLILYFLFSFTVILF